LEGIYGEAKGRKQPWHNLPAQHFGRVTGVAATLSIFCDVTREGFWGDVCDPVRTCAGAQNAY